MSDLRYDPVFDLWVVVAENRRDRPIEFVPIEQTFKQLICPFCCGNEEETPPEIMRLDHEGRSQSGSSAVRWQTRVIPNKYPTYFEGASDSPMPAISPYEQSRQSGDQELIIPTPRHVFSFSELSAEEFTVGLRAAQLRMLAKEGNPLLEHTMLFGNCRYEAGASVAHVHFQLIGSPLISPALSSRTERFGSHRLREGVSLMESMLQVELTGQTRIVAETDDFVMFCPFSSRHAFQVWIAPRTRGVAFCRRSVDDLRQVVELSQQYLSRVENLLSEPAYNWMLHQLPTKHQADDHWFIEILPRIAKNAGYEMGTDIWINPVAPEVAARRLR